jgi:hypothetical protein
MAGINPETPVSDKIYLNYNGAVDIASLANIERLIRKEGILWHKKRV